VGNKAAIRNPVSFITISSNSTWKMILGRVDAEPVTNRPLAATVYKPFEIENIELFLCLIIYANSVETDVLGEEVYFYNIWG
jgi:hypothetical protein